MTLTHPDMTRFIMTLPQAVSLVMDAVFLARGGEVFVTKMDVCRIEDLARVMIDELAPRHGRGPDEVEIEVIGPKPGEKFYEELINDEEVRRVVRARPALCRRAGAACQSALDRLSVPWPSRREHLAALQFDQCNVDDA